MVGLLWPLNLPWGLWQYTKNFYNKNQLVDSDDEIVENIPPPADADKHIFVPQEIICLLYTSPSPRDRQKSRMPSSA